MGAVCLPWPHGRYSPAGDRSFEEEEEKETASAVPGNRDDEVRTVGMGNAGVEFHRRGGIRGDHGPAWAENEPATGFRLD